MRGSTLEKEWKTKAGHDAKVLWVNGSHRCGYVRIPEDHPLFKVEYNENVIDCKDYLKDKKVGKRNFMNLLFNAGKDLYDSTVLFDIHGSITYSGQPYHDGIESEGFWYGYDCAHAGDKTRYDSFGEERTLEYCIDECESLSRQLEEVRSIIVIKKGENNEKDS